MPAQLTCKDLKPGDVMLKVSDGSAINEAIRFGQRITGGTNSKITHAGLMFDSRLIIEALEKGISASDLRVQNKSYAYYVYRCQKPYMAVGAGTCAKMMFDINQAQGTLKYTILGAAKSLFGSGKVATRGEMDALLDRILSGKNKSFFCTMFVAYVYQFVAEQSGIPGKTIFNEAAAKVPPTKLASMIAQNPHFTEVGWMLPDQR